MKKIILIILIFLCFGCTKKNFLKEEYYNDVNILKNQEIVSSSIPPFSIFLDIEKNTDSEISYKLVLKDPSDASYNFKVLIIHDQFTNNKYPSSGIMDKKLSLVPNVVNKSSGYVSEITLKGYIDYEGDIKDFRANFKVMINYENVDRVSKTYYYQKQY